MSFADIAKPKYTKLLRLLLISWQYGAFVVKTHSAPSNGTRLLGQLGLIKTSYIYRDPRDRLLSLMDMGKRAKKAEDSQSPFWDMDTFEGALSHIRTALRHKQAWEAQPNVLLTRYEDLVLNTVNEIKRLAQHIGIDIDEETSQNIVAKYDPKKLSSDQGFTNYQKGKIGRYKDVLSPEQLEIIHKTMGSDIEALGYALD